MRELFVKREGEYMEIKSRGKITEWGWADPGIEEFPQIHITLRGNLYEILKSTCMKYQKNFSLPLILEGENVFEENGYFATDLRSLLMDDVEIIKLIGVIEFIVSSIIFQKKRTASSVGERPYTVIYFICKDENPHQIFGHSPAIKL